MADETPASELLTLYGNTTGATGTFSLSSDLIVTAVTSIVLPKGMTAKVWSRLVSGSGAIVNIQYANNGSTFRTLVTDQLSAVGDISVEKRRPHLFRSSAGTEAIQMTYTGGPTGSSAYVAFDVELTQDG